MGRLADLRHPPDYQAFVRTGKGGKLRVEPDGSLPLPPGKTDGNPSEEPGFWIGLAMLQTLFTLEHNAVCDMLAGHYPTWTDDEIFQRARLVIAALIAKIHTVEWTPGRHQPPDDRDRRCAPTGSGWPVSGSRTRSAGSAAAR